MSTRAQQQRDLAGSHFPTADHQAVAVLDIEKNRQKIHLFHLERLSRLWHSALLYLKIHITNELVDLSREMQNMQANALFRRFCLRSSTEIKDFPILPRGLIFPYPPLFAMMHLLLSANIRFMLNIDLHCHSTVSDGLLTPTQLVEHAATRGVRCWR